MPRGGRGRRRHAHGCCSVLQMVAMGFVGFVSFVMFRWFAALMSNNRQDTLLLAMAGGNPQVATGGGGGGGAFSQGFAPLLGANNMPAAGVTGMAVANTWSPEQRNRYEVVHNATSVAVYQPSPVESYIMSHMPELEMNLRPPNLVNTCKIWRDQEASPHFRQLHTFNLELAQYYNALLSFELEAGVTDIRRQLVHLPARIEGANDPDSNLPNRQVCSKLELHPDGLAKGIFGGSQLLSQTAHTGFIEPLLPPMRHPGLCLEPNVGVNGQKMDVLMSLRYLVHDWAAICRSLKPTSRTVFVDMGASLQFHETSAEPSPALKLLNQYRRMGIVFDHIYAYEVSQASAELVYQQVPPQFRSAFHWINVGVSADPQHIHNPLKLLTDNFNADDFIVVKLDIDSHGFDKSLERSLADQIFDSPQ